MNPDQIAAAYSALQGAVTTSANTGVAQVNTNAATKAPALAPTGYDAGRYVTPVANATADKLVVAAKQALLKKVLTDAQTTSGDNYTAANQNYQTRQRKYYRDQAIAAAKRQASADALTAAQAKIASGQTGGGAVIVNKAAPIIPANPVIQTSPTLQTTGAVQPFLQGTAPVSVNAGVNSAGLRVRL